MTFKILFLILLVFTIIPLASESFAFPDPGLRILVVETDLDGFGGGGILMIAPDSLGGMGQTQTELVGSGVFGLPEDIEVHNGDAYVLDTDEFGLGGIYEIDLDDDGSIISGPTLISALSNFGLPLGIDISNTDILYAADSVTGNVYSLDINTGIVTNIAILPAGTIPRDVVLDKTNNILYILNIQSSGPGILSIDLSNPSTTNTEFAGDLSDGQQIEVRDNTTEFYVTHGIISATAGVKIISGGTSSPFTPTSLVGTPFGIDIDESTPDLDVYVSDSSFVGSSGDPGTIFRFVGMDFPPAVNPIEESSGDFLFAPAGIALLTLTVSPIDVDLGITKTGPLSSSPGSGLTYTIDAQNNDQEGDVVPKLIFADDLPPANGGINIDSFSATKTISGNTVDATGECTSATPLKIECEINGPFAPGDSAQLIIDGTVQPGSTGPLVNTVALSNSPGYTDSNPMDNTDTVTTSISVTPDFSNISITDDPSTVTAGQSSLDYDISFTNTGDSATDVILTNTLPSGVTYQGFTFSGSTSPPICSELSGLVTCDFGSVNNQNGGTLTLTMDVDPAAQDPLVNSAEISCFECPTPTPFTATESTDVDRVTTLSATMTSDKDPVFAGEDLEYEITIDNSGPSTASNVVVTDTLPPGVTFLSSNPAICSESGPGIITCNLPDLQPNSQTILTISTNVDSSNLVTPLTNLVDVTSDESSTSISLPVDLDTTAELIPIVTAPSPVTPGQSFDYSVNVENNGPSDALNLKVTATLPTGITFVPNGNNCQEVSPGEIECHNPSIHEDVPAGVTITKLISVQVESGASPGPITINGEVVALDTTDPDEENNLFSLTVDIEDNVADLEIEKSSEVIVTGGTSGVIDVRVMQSSDDAEEEDDDVYFADNDLDMNEKDYVGLRFQGINIPQGATITNAYVQFTVEDENGDKGNAEVKIYGQDADDTSTFTTNDNDISSRPFTSAFVEWDIPNWYNENESGPAQTTPDLSPIVQEIVDRSGWAGKSIVMIIEEDKGKDRDAKAWDLDPSKAPLLHIEFDNNDEMTEVIYTLTITNNGPGDATNVQVTDNLPPEVTATNVIPVTECSIDGPQLVTCEFALLTSGSQQIITIDTTVDPGTTGIITNIASVSADQEDPDETNNEVIHETEITSDELFCGRSISEFNVIDGTPNNDVLIGTHDDDLIRGFGGNDFINAKKGNDCVFGGEGKDKILGRHGDDTIEGNEGKDRIFGGKGDDVIFGNQGNDRLMGGLGDDGISGGEGKDIIRGGPGDDRVSAGPGNDKLFGQSGDDSLSADAGNDKVFGGNGDDFLNGGENHDFCKGGPGEDVITNCEKGDPNTGGGDQKQLTGTIRDFHDSHDDMEQGCSGGLCSSVEPGIVKTTLGIDKKPVFNQDAVSTNGEANFEQWYNDVPSVNMADDITLILDNSITSDPSVYTFESGPGFFPIDDDCDSCDPLFGNEGNSHNYHFTIEFHSEIEFQEDQMFKFTGDDDVWVFIDDTLVIDLGGVHPQTSAEITSQDLIDLGLETGEDYDLDIFFAERQTVQSNFRIDTSMTMD